MKYSVFEFLISTLVSPFLTIRYHREMAFARWNVVQNKQIRIIQQGEIVNYDHKTVDKQGIGMI
jgi:hypothetical protein